MKSIWSSYNDVGSLSLARLTGLALLTVLLAHTNHTISFVKAAADPNPEIKVVEANRLKKEIAEYSGRVVVVNFWATWCGPCREELPDLVKFAERFRGKGVVVLTVSLDDVESLNGVKKFLTDYKVNLTNFLLDFSDSDMDAFINSIDAKWSGALPATFVYDKNGARVQKIIGGATEKHFERLVKPLL